MLNGCNEQELIFVHGLLERKKLRINLLRKISTYLNKAINMFLSKTKFKMNVD